MARTAKHKDTLVQAAVELFRKQGYAATGTAEILKRSGAPRGSLYHYFPGGKEDIGAAAVMAASKGLSRTIREIAAEVKTTADFIEIYAAKLAGWMETSGYRDGNPLTTIILETVPQSTQITLEAEKSYEIWCGLFADMLQADGWPAQQCRPTAQMILAALDGALVNTRIKRDSAVIKSVASELAHYLRTAV